MKKTNDVKMGEQCKLFRLVHVTAFLKSTYLALIFFYWAIFLSMFEGNVKSLPVNMSITFSDVLIAFFSSLLVLLSISLFQGRNILRYNKDVARNNFERETVVLLYSSSISKKYAWFLPNVVFWKPKIENPQYHKMVFRSVIQPDKIGSVQYLNTNKRNKILEKLYKCETEYFDLGIRVHRKKFSGELPLEIVYGKDSLFLKEICPVEGYSYSEEQRKWLDCWSRKTIPEQAISIDEEDVENYHSPTPKIFQKRIGRFFYALTVLVGMALAAALLFWSTIGFFDLLVHRNLMSQPEVYPLLYWVAYGLFYGLIRLHQVLFEGIPICNDKKDREKNQFVQVKCTLVSSLRLTMYHDSLRYFMRKEWPEGHFCNTKVCANDSEDFFTYIITREKLKELRRIYNIVAVNAAWYSGYSFNCVIAFQNEVPLLVTYGKSSHVLQSIAPAEDYDYTPEQLAAIERFNTLYP